MRWALLWVRGVGKNAYNIWEVKLRGTGRGVWFSYESHRGHYPKCGGAEELSYRASLTMQTKGYLVGKTQLMKKKKKHIQGCG